MLSVSEGMGGNFVGTLFLLSLVEERCRRGWEKWEGG